MKKSTIIYDSLWQYPTEEIPASALMTYQGVLFVIASIERTRSGMIYVLISAIIELILLTIQTYYLSNKHITSMVKE